MRRADGVYARAIELGQQAIVAAELADVVEGRPDPTRLGLLHDRQRWFLWESGRPRGRGRPRSLKPSGSSRLTRRWPPVPVPSAKAAGLRLFSRRPDTAP